ncbi:hypothetical protein STEG23_036071 [Scotinomys teguina]
MREPKSKACKVTLGGQKKVPDLLEPEFYSVWMLEAGPESPARMLRDSGRRTAWDCPSGFQDPTINLYMWMEWIRKFLKEKKYFTVHKLSSHPILFSSLIRLLAIRTSQRSWQKKVLNRPSTLILLIYDKTAVSDQSELGAETEEVDEEEKSALGPESAILDGLTHCSGIPDN